MFVHPGVVEITQVIKFLPQFLKGFFWSISAKSGLLHSSIPEVTRYIVPFGAQNTVTDGWPEWQVLTSHFCWLNITRLFYDIYACSAFVCNFLGLSLQNVIEVVSYLATENLPIGKKKDTRVAGQNCYSLTNVVIVVASTLVNLDLMKTIIYLFPEDL